MASIVISGDTSGAITLAAPAVAGTNTLTLPANTGTIITTASTFAGTGPAFSVYLSADQTPTANTWVKMPFNTEEFDTANCFDSTTNYRFTPNVAGYYQINCMLVAQGSSNRNDISLYKNGSAYKTQLAYQTANFLELVINQIVYMNGSTDYLEIYFRSNTNTGYVNGTSAYTTFSGSMVRGA